MYWYKSMMSTEPRNEPRMLRWFRKTYPSYNLQPLLLKRYRELEEARAFQGQRLIPLKVAHHLLKARALIEAVGPKCLHLLLRNFVRRPFHAPALGARVAQLGHLAAHGLRQPAHIVQVPLPLLRLPALPHLVCHKPLLPGRFCAVQRGPQPSAPAAHTPAGNSRGWLPHSRRGHGRGRAPGTKATAEPALRWMTWRETPRPAPWPATGRGRPPSQHCRRRAGGSAFHRRRGRGARGRAGLPLSAAPGRGRLRAPERAAPSGPGAAASADHVMWSASWTRRGSARRRWSVARRRPLRRRRPWLRRRARLPLPPRDLGGLAEGAAALAPTAGEVAGTLAGAAGVGAAATAGLAVGIAGGAAYGLARGTGWVLENTLFRPQQGSEDAAVQDVRSANNMNDATQPQHFTLRTGSSTSGSPASSRASSQSGFRVQAQSNNTPRPFSWGLRASSSSGQSRRSLPPPSFDQLAQDIEAA